MMRLLQPRRVHHLLQVYHHHHYQLQQVGRLESVCPWLRWQQALECSQRLTLLVAHRRARFVCWAICLRQRSLVKFV